MHDWAALLGDWPEPATLGYNISPAAMIPAYTGGGGQVMRWGLIPSWAREVAGKYSTFNARAESVAVKPAFKHAWKHSQRCLIPALGYYEWRLEAGAKQPYFVSLPRTDPMVMAGLYEPARGDEIPASCAILTKAASAKMAELHQRVPVILPLTLAQAWFASEPEQAMELMNSDHALPLSFYPVSKSVNNARNDSAALIDAIPRTAAML